MDLNLCISCCWPSPLACSFFFFFNILFIYLVAPGLSCSRRVPLLWHANSKLWHARGILVPWPGIEPRPPVLGARSLNHCATREVPTCMFSLHVTCPKQASLHAKPVPTLGSRQRHCCPSRANQKPGTPSLSPSVAINAQGVWTPPWKYFSGMHHPTPTGLG